MDGIVADTTTLSHSGPGSNGNEGLFHRSSEQELHH